MLRLVHPAPGGQGTDPPAKGRRRPPYLALAPEEARRLRAAIKNTARAYGGYDVLADVIGMSRKNLWHAATVRRRALSPGLALAVARAAGMSVEAVLTGKLAAAGCCPTCGHRVGDGRVVAAGGAR